MIVFELQYFFKNNSCVYYIAKIFYQTVFETVKKPTFFLIDERTKPSVPVALLPSQSHIIVLTSFVKID
jgi:hypothetical protein